MKQRPPPYFVPFNILLCVRAPLPLVQQAVHGYAFMHFFLFRKTKITRVVRLFFAAKNEKLEVILGLKSVF